MFSIITIYRTAIAVILAVFTYMYKKGARVNSALF